MGVQGGVEVEGEGRGGVGGVSRQILFTVAQRVPLALPSTAAATHVCYMDI